MSYKDPNKKFLQTAMMKIEFFNGINEAALIEIMYSFRKSTYKASHVLFKQDQNADCLSIVYEGVVEFYTYFEDFEFVIERLYPGSIYNFRTFFMEDLMYVNARCEGNVTLLEISKSALEEIMEKHDDFKRKMLSYQNQILKFDITYPLDYLVNVPKEFQGEKIYSEDALKRDNAFKNAIMRRVVEIRFEKQKPKLSDILKMFRGKDKEVIRKKMFALYERQEKDEENSKYTVLMSLFDRVHKVLGSQLSALASIDRRITHLQRLKNKNSHKKK